MAGPIVRIEGISASSVMVSAVAGSSSALFHSADLFPTSRSSRRCFPVLQRWRNERLVLESGNVVGVVKPIDPVPKSRNKKATDKHRHKSLCTSCGWPAEINARDQSAQLLEGIPDKSSKVASSLRSSRADILPIAMEFGASPLRSSICCVASPLRSSRADIRPITMEFDAESAKASAPVAAEADYAPKKSKLRVAGRDLKKPRGDEQRRICFAEAIADVHEIKSFRDCDDLWYDRILVECNRCNREVEFGTDQYHMSSEGAEGRGPMAKWHVVCSSCIGDLTLQEMGAWLVIGLTASANDIKADQTSNARVAEKPLIDLVDRLSHWNTRGARFNSLESLLGQATSDIRETIFAKARSSVSRFLNPPSATGSSRSDDIQNLCHAAVEPELREPALARNTRLLTIAPPAPAPESAVKKRGSGRPRKNPEEAPKAKRSKCWPAAGYCSTRAPLAWASPLTSSGREKEVELERQSSSTAAKRDRSISTEFGCRDILDTGVAPPQVQEDSVRPSALLKRAKHATS